MVGYGRECEYTGAKTPGAAVLHTPLMPDTVWQIGAVPLPRSALKRELLQLLEGDEENDVPRPQSQPVRPESLIESEEALVLPRLHHAVQCSFVQGAS